MEAITSSCSLLVTRFLGGTGWCLVVLKSMWCSCTVQRRRSWSSSQSRPASPGIRTRRLQCLGIRRSDGFIWFLDKTPCANHKAGCLSQDKGSQKDAPSFTRATESKAISLPRERERDGKRKRDPIAMASTLLVMASNPIAMASNLKERGKDTHFTSNKKLLVTRASRSLL